MVPELAIQTTNLKRTFGDFTAVEDLNLKIHKGEIFGLLGPNGAGKTTTIRMLCGILLPSAGEGFVLGYDIARQAEKIKQNIGYMSQLFSLYNDLTAVENLRFYAQIYGLPAHSIENRVQELIDMAGLHGLESQITVNLSGAWRQRLALTCAIVHHPPMLFLDEPTAGVDPSSRKEFWDLIYQLAREGVTVLATTHYMDEAEYCQSIGMMYRSRLIVQASPHKLKTSLPNRILEIECDQPSQAIEVINEMPGVKDVSPYGLLLHAALDASNPVPAKTIQKELTRRGICISRMEEVQPSLEDIFLNTISAIEKR